MVPKQEWDTSFAWRDALDNGAVLVFGSDWPIVSCDVRKGINHAVTREPWYEGARHQNVTLEEAVTAYTSGAAFTEYSSSIKGDIKPGMLADIVVLSDDIASLGKGPDDVDVVTTICDGKIVYKGA